MFAWKPDKKDSHVCLDVLLMADGLIKAFGGAAPENFPLTPKTDNPSFLSVIYSWPVYVVMGDIASPTSTMPWFSEIHG